MADDLVREAILQRLVATPFGSLGRRAVIDDVARALDPHGEFARTAAERVRREGAAMVAERLLGPAGEGMWRLTDAGRRAAAPAGASDVDEVHDAVEAAPPGVSPTLKSAAEEHEPSHVPQVSTATALTVVPPHQRPALPVTAAEAQRWVHAPGTRMSREERQHAYGGAIYGGIQPSRRTLNVFVYSDPGAGEKNGYNFDGWSPDGSVFTYTGEGRTGGQEMTKGNKAILEHRRDERSLRVFVADGYLAGSGAKDHVYLVSSR
ncbi:hypothetical protein SAMN06264364_14517 [Quadrisphaera granulorum]|uniref:ScoMcrA-like SRA domain-containing protein n=1 Tax=Quadrisphaera granulorum TaxID=317664 RepID=A0A315ZNF0_9ACTN|nr:hypothetical protein [Quadrisphaera granulorum]PWJ46862.1 hypothetical protein BXY45_14517 [Quadrisphaera granulorum]SZE99029.1 hypothetical protein SAMN06264364_14517 [Quadrisphaera granulorum]